MTKKQRKAKPSIKGNSKHTPTTYRQMAYASLKAMLNEWKTKKSWQDSEQEEPGQSLLFKRNEALLCFLLPSEIRKKEEAAVDIPEGHKWFFSELESLLSQIQKDGFDPNPYTYIKGKTFNFVDCASTLLELLILVKKHLSHTNNYKTQAAIIEKIANKALIFLLAVADVEKDKRLSWAANENTKFKGQSLTNVYFTSFAIRALSIFASEKPWEFNEVDHNRILESIQGAANWLVDRFDEQNNLLYFDKQKNASSYFDYGLMVLSLCQAYDYLSDIQKVKVNNIMNIFLKKLPLEFEAPRFIHFLPSPGESPVYYDNRLSIGVLVSALCRVTVIPGLSYDMDETLFSKLRAINAKLLQLRSSRNDLWDEDGYLITSTLWGIFGLLNMDVSGRVASYTVEEQQLYRILKKALNDPRVAKSFLQVIQEELVSIEEK
jgi:hypothetical protein